jgi:peptidoglycan/xylan/chitin deacetylase (PgdA/CDA1 family)
MELDRRTILKAGIGFLLLPDDMIFSQISRRKIEEPPTPPPNPRYVDSGPKDKMQVALTFDLCMDPFMDWQRSNKNVSYYNKAIAPILIENQIKATFMVSGLWAKSYPQELQYLASNPLFKIGSHSYLHEAFEPNCYGLLTVKDKVGDIKNAQETLRSFGIINNIFRFPGDCKNDRDIDLAYKEGLTTIGAGVAGGDPFTYNVGNIINNVSRGVRPGSIITLHDLGAPNAPVTHLALPSILKILQDRGLTSVTIDELANLNAYPNEP